MCDVGIQCCLQPLTLRCTAIQTEFEDAAMTTRINTKVPPPTQANTTKRHSLPTDESQTGVLPLSKTSVINAEEWKVNNDRNYVMHAPPYVVFPTYEDNRFRCMRWKFSYLPLLRKRMRVMKVMVTMNMRMMNLRTQIGICHQM